MLLILWVVALAAAVPHAQDQALVAPETDPTIVIPSCPNQALIPSLRLSDNSGPFPARTEVRVCHTNDAFNVTFANHDETFIRNDYRECNSDMWNQEVNEIFLSFGQEVPTTYLEVEVSPFGFLYAAWIYNPYGNGTDKQNTMIDCDSSGIAWSATIHEPTGEWNSSLTIPFSLFTNTNNSMPWDSTSLSYWRANIFRVFMEDSTDICTPSSCAFGAWSPTFKTPPQFHIPFYFGQFLLLDQQQEPN